MVSGKRRGRKGFLHLGERFGEAFVKESLENFVPERQVRRDSFESQFQNLDMLAELTALFGRNYLVRDQDFKYSNQFDALFESAHIAVEPTVRRAPNQNAFVERWIGSIKHECLQRFVAFGIGHLDYLVVSYVEHYLSARRISERVTSRWSGSGATSMTRRTSKKRLSPESHLVECSSTTNASRLDFAPQAVCGSFVEPAVLSPGATCAALMHLDEKPRRLA
jgi:hypothetical protein